MKRIIIACQTLQDELSLAVQETGCAISTVWVDSKYHMDPAVLRLKLQAEIDKLHDIDQILFAYGACGNGLVGLQATTAELVIPKTDDCISLMLTSPDRVFERQKQTYFLTKGWLEGSKSLVNEYRHTLARYGVRRTEKIFESMLKHYKQLMLIDTGAYKLEDCLVEAEQLAQNINLKLVIDKGSLWFLKQLLLGPYDNNFCRVPKGESVTMGHFGYSTNTPFHQVI